MKVTEIKRNKLVEKTFGELEAGTPFLDRYGYLFLKGAAPEKAIGLENGAFFSLPPDAPAIPVKAEIRYSEIYEQEDPDSIIPRGIGKLEALRLAACKRVLISLRKTDGPENLIEMLEEAVGPE